MEHRRVTARCTGGCGSLIERRRDGRWITAEMSDVECEHVPDYPYWDDDLQSLVIKETDVWLMTVCPMIFNDRVIWGYQSERHIGHSYGWCYDKGAAAVLAAQAWNPDEQGEPVGYKKAPMGHRVVEGSEDE